METDTLRPQYFKQFLAKGIRKIFSEQKRIAGNKIYGPELSARSQGSIREALENPKYLVSADNFGVQASLEYPLHLRFLDMKRMKNVKVYNRVLWGILYKETFVDIRFEFSKWVSERIKGDLGDTFKILEKT